MISSYKYLFVMPDDYTIEESRFEKEFKAVYYLSGEYKPKHFIATIEIIKILKRKRYIHIQDMTYYNITSIKIWGIIEKILCNDLILMCKHYSSESGDGSFEIASADVINEAFFVMNKHVIPEVIKENESKT